MQESIKVKDKAEGKRLIALLIESGEWVTPFVQEEEGEYFVRVAGLSKQELSDYYSKLMK
jgi:hypothetical protein